MRCTVEATTPAVLAIARVLAARRAVSARSTSARAISRRSDMRLGGRVVNVCNLFAPL
jgi:hypothetical protein